MGQLIGRQSYLISNNKKKSFQFCMEGFGPQAKGSLVGGMTVSLLESTTPNQNKKSISTAKINSISEKVVQHS